MEEKPRESNSEESILSKPPLAPGEDIAHGVRSGPDAIEHKTIDQKARRSDSEESVHPKPSSVPAADVQDEIQSRTEGIQNLQPRPEQLYDRVYDFLAHRLSKLRSGSELTLPEGTRIVAEMIDSPAAIEALYHRAINRPQGLEQLPSHLTNVSIYALKIGLGLKYQREDLFRLAFSGLFYDIGLAKVPESILNKSKRLTEEERNIISQHTQYGYDILRAALPKASSWLARAALEHHERENGEGYPQESSGEQIHEYSKIIGLVDIYDAMTQVRPYRKRRPPFNAVREILRSERGRFPANILKVLLMKLSVFPIGSYVRLSSETIARVVEVRETAPLRPKVEILYDSQGRRSRSRKVIDLQETTIIHIMSPVEEEELPQT